jgi:hypothetical protein
MSKILFVTGLYSKQKYAQAERIEAFNAASKECKKHGLAMTVMTVVNNSPKSFAPWLEKLHKAKAKFPYLIEDIGQKTYRVEMDSGAKAIAINPETGEISPVEEFDAFRSAGRTKMEQFDIYRLMAEIHNRAFDYATENGFDYVSIQTGDQIIPKEHPIVLTEFLKQHPLCGQVNGLVYFDYTKEKKVVDGVERETYKPMVCCETPEHTNWLCANMLPTKEHGGLEYAEVYLMGAGGCVIPRSVFADKQFRFNEKWQGVGEDIAFCKLLKEKGRKVFIVPWLKIPNRYPNGELY